ncbi:hypothetical protein D3C86_1609640 [compost metagenome]
MLFGELQGFDQANHFVYFTTQWQVVHHLVLDNALLVDQEGGTQCHAGFVLDTVGASDLVLDVGHHGELHLANAAILHRGVAPGVVSELRVDGNADDFHAQVAEAIHAVVVGNDFRRADKGEVQRPEEQNNVFAAQGRKLEAVDDRTVAQHRRRIEIRGLLVDQNAHEDSLEIKVQRRFKSCAQLSEVTQIREIPFHNPADRNVLFS